MDENAFLVRSVYDHHTLTVMSRALRKTQRRWLSIAMRIFGWTVFSLSALFQILLALLGAFLWDTSEAVLFLAMFVILAALLGEDHLNSWIASWNLVPGTREAETAFGETEYECTTQAAVSRWPYANIRTLCETKDYFVFFLSKRHGQIYPKSGFAQGTPEAFREFVQEKTGKQFRFVK